MIWKKSLAKWKIWIGEFKNVMDKEDVKRTTDFPNAVYGPVDRTALKRERKEKNAAKSQIYYYNGEFSTGQIRNGVDVLGHDIEVVALKTTPMLDKKGKLVVSNLTLGQMAYMALITANKNFPSTTRETRIPQFGHERYWFKVATDTAPELQEGVSNDTVDDYCIQCEAANDGAKFMIKDPEFGLVRIGLYKRDNHRYSDDDAVL